MREIKFRAWDELNKEMRLAWHPRFKVDGYITEILQDEILMQYTGLKDKNGKEIYEGDILKNLEGKLSTIEYDAPHFIVRHVPEGGSDFPTTKNYFEVIGNVHENPESLEITE